MSREFRWFFPEIGWKLPKFPTHLRENLTNFRLIIDNVAITSKPPKFMFFFQNAPYVRLRSIRRVRGQPVCPVYPDFSISRSWVRGYFNTTRRSIIVYRVTLRRHEIHSISNYFYLSKSSKLTNFNVGLIDLLPSVEQQTLNADTLSSLWSTACVAWLIGISHVFSTDLPRRWVTENRCIKLHVWPNSSE